MMSTKTLVFLALFVLAAQCHVLNNKESVPNRPDHRREKRSCYVCEYGKGPPLAPKPGFGPPPPPPYFRTQNWNGITRSTDGSNQGVFSGASVAANTQAAGRTYSVASSSANAGIGSQASGGQSTGYEGQSSGHGRKSADYGDQPKANAQIKFKEGQNLVGSNYQINLAHMSGSGNNHYRRKDQDFQGQQQSQSNDFVSGQSSNSNSPNTAQVSGSEISRNKQQQVQSADGGFGNWHNHGPEKYQNGESLRANNVQQVQTSGKGQWDRSGSESDNNFGSSQSTASGAQHVTGASGSSANADSYQEAFKGTLNLASQGLQTAKQTSNTGCSSCNKGSYAFSNAKSDSGNAIALSIGR